MTRLNKTARGFSLAEVLIALTIFFLLLAVSGAAYTKVGAANRLEIAQKSVAGALRSAQLRSEQGNGDSSWGVKISSGQALLFKGSSYGTRDQSADQSLVLSGGVIVSGLSEVIFSPVTGNPTSTGVIIFSNSAGTKNISINEKGTLTY